MKYLQSAESEDCDPDVPVERVGDPLGQVSEMDAGRPAGHPDAVPEQLASDVKVEPRRVSRPERLEVSREDGSHGQQKPPAHRIQDPMSLQEEKNGWFDETRKILDSVRPGRNRWLTDGSYMTTMAFLMGTETSSSVCHRSRGWHTTVTAREFIFCGIKFAS
jgi:hypothetical protein